MLINMLVHPLAVVEISRVLHPTLSNQTCEGKLEVIPACVHDSTP